MPITPPEAEMAALSLEYGGSAYLPAPVVQQPPPSINPEYIVAMGRCLQFLVNQELKRMQQPGPEQLEAFARNLIRTMIDEERTRVVG
jgi:hypothetical protein